ncbi:MAG TPA: type II secretion system protein [Gaiellaceae bacterium]|nr:type II secretion system protein [Gaiellaceae bacterium]
MPVRGSDQDGFLMVELIVATVVLSIALLALMAGYDTAFFSVRKANQKSAAATLANAQLELYSSLPYNSIGLDQTTTNDVGDSTNAAYDSLYATNSILDGESGVRDGVPYHDPDGVVNEVEIPSCGTAPSCQPIQTLTGSDGRTYRVETFIRDVTEGTSDISFQIRNVWVLVRDPSAAGEPVLVSLHTAFNDGS